MMSPQSESVPISPDVPTLRCWTRPARRTARSSPKTWRTTPGSLEISGRGLKHAGIVFTSTRRFPRAAGGSGALLGALEKLLADRPAEDALEGVTVWLEPRGGAPSAC